MRTEILKFGRIRDLRVDRGLTQREVAERTGVSQMSVSRTERSALEQLRRAVLSDE